ncbi:STM4504/CBY_0614 family protein [Pseudomonas pergaminensis]|uniref:STM4504/CBY_0614 family protein n=1 Tax=Pseudomonas pergaminensis TaxID=2853159 RepID=A0ABW8R0Z3_9PSED
MAIFDIFSKRQKKLRGETPEVYQYDQLPDALRVQIVHAMCDALGLPNDHPNQDCWKFVSELLCREYGLFALPTARQHGQRVLADEVINFFLQTEDLEQALDVVELCFRAVDTVSRQTQYLWRNNANEIADASIDELNKRFQEHGVGYQFVNGEILRVDSQLLHAEVVKPALRLLENKFYAGPQDEFLKAHEHYRHGNSKEALNECLKSFESLMKAICVKRGWAVSGKETASSLIKVCMENGLIPAFWQTQFTSLKSLLEAAVPTGRNNLAGHGQGAEPTAVPDYLVAYMLHMTGACLVFLATAEQRL